MARRAARLRPGRPRVALHAGTLRKTLGIPDAGTGRRKPPPDHEQRTAPPAPVTPSLTVVVAVYNAAHYLELVLCALRRQSMPDFEVVIADDGSGPPIAELLGTAAGGLLLRHCWQPDEGFRKNRMLNEAVARSATDYLLFIDGDCVPHRHFVRDHWLHRRED